jgi:hypothetical protein
MHDLERRIRDLRKRQTELVGQVLSLDERINQSQQTDSGFHPGLNQLYAALGDTLYNLGQVDARMEDAEALKRRMALALNPFPAADVMRLRISDGRSRSEGERR